MVRWMWQLLKTAVYLSLWRHHVLYIMQRVWCLNTSKHYNMFFFYKTLDNCLCPIAIRPHYSEEHIKNIFKRKHVWQNWNRWGCNSLGLLDSYVFYHAWLMLELSNHNHLWSLIYFLLVLMLMHTSFTTSISQALVVRNTTAMWKPGQLWLSSI
jgi:hypothetical protein